MRREGTMEVRFVICRDGSIENIALASGSGSLELDNAAIQAITRVGHS
jgi:TonB family protein